MLQEWRGKDVFYPKEGTKGQKEKQKKEEIVQNNIVEINTKTSIVINVNRLRSLMNISLY